MSRILVLFAHPALEKSRAHQELLNVITGMKGVTINDLYQNYPDFDIDVEREKELLTTHDIIIWQHPLYWYSAPALLKEWQDLVLEHGWAYGHKGRALAGKKIFNALTSGGGMEAYENSTHHKYALRDYLRPFECTAHLCRMTYWPPFWIHGVHRMQKQDMEAFGVLYRVLLTNLRNETLPEEDILQAPLFNDLFPHNTITQP